MESIYIYIPCDDSYIGYLILNIYSILKHTKAESSLEFHIPHSMSLENIDRLHTLFSKLNFKGKYFLWEITFSFLKSLGVPKSYYRLLNKYAIRDLYEILKDPTSEVNFNKSVLFYPILIPYIFKEPKKLLFLNADLLFRSPIEELYNIRNPRKDLMACVPDWSGLPLSKFVSDYASHGLDPKMDVPNASVSIFFKGFYEIIPLIYELTLKNLFKSKLGLKYSFIICLKNNWFRLGREWNVILKQLYYKDGSSLRCSAENLISYTSDTKLKIDPKIVHFSTLEKNSNLSLNPLLVFKKKYEDELSKILEEV